jgi:uncharacterized protein (TIGR03435 family)
MDMMGVTFKMLMAHAYAVRDFQIIGGPAWITSERYDIQAKAEDGRVPASTGMRDPTVPAGMSFLIQSLLDDRFQLKMHHETRDLPVYELAVARGGSKLQLSADQSPSAPDTQERGSLFIRRIPAGWTLQATAVPLSTLISALSNQMGTPIVDKSNLKPGLYDVSLQWAPDRTPAEGVLDLVGNRVPVLDDPQERPIFGAIQEQLGLRLVSAKGRVEVLVIDAVQKPSAN